MNKRGLLYASLNSLLVFHEVSKHRSFSKAAEELFISQPAVTKHIKELECRVGMGLIQRRRGGFLLTDAGKILFKYTHKISSHLMDIENLLEDLKKEHQGILKIGTTESYSKGLMPKLLSGFQTSFPFMKIALDVGNYPLIIRAKGSTTRRIILQAFKEVGIHPSLYIEAGSSEFIKQWVSEGKGVCIIVKRTVEDEEKRGIIKTIPLLEKLYLQVAFLYLKKEKSNPAIKTFVNFIENQGRKLIKSEQ